MSQDQEAVVLRLRSSDLEYGAPDEREAVYEVEDRLVATVTAGALGEVDGHEFGDGFATIYLYGPSAERLEEAVRVALSGVNLRAGSSLTRRFGPPGAPEETDSLG